MRAPRRSFDRKFGEDFIKNVPLCPGVYEVLDANGSTIYVGKAKILRRRLRQYRNAKRRKKHHKMRAIVAEAHSVRYTACQSDLEALLLENKMIQSLRPRLNIAGAFSFLYPCVGLLRSGRDLHLCYSTSPQEFSMFEFYGAYRSRDITKEGFMALLEILGFIGHREPAKKLPAYPRVKFSLVAGFRQVPEEWLVPLKSFLRGESKEFLERAVMALVEKPYARHHPDEIQEFLDALKRFYKFEAVPLRRAMAANGIRESFLPQADRDRIFLRSRAGREDPQQSAQYVNL